jgi:hypothetical protein
MTPSEIEPANLGLVAQCLNKLRYLELLQDALMERFLTILYDLS